PRHQREPGGHEARRSAADRPRRPAAVRGGGRRGRASADDEAVDGCPRARVHRAARHAHDGPPDRGDGRLPGVRARRLEPGGGGGGRGRRTRQVTARSLSLAWLTVRDAHPLEHIDAAVAGGFDAVGLRLVPVAPGDPLVPVVGDEPLVREIAARLAGSGVTVLDVESVWIGPDIDVAALRPALAVAERLGSRNRRTMGTDGDIARLTENFARLCEEAARFRLQVGVEFAAYTHVPTIQAAEALVRKASQPNGKILIDALHFARSGGTPPQIARL